MVQFNQACPLPNPIGAFMEWKSLQCVKVIPSSLEVQRTPLSSEHDCSRLQSFVAIGFLVERLRNRCFYLLEASLRGDSFHFIRFYLHYTSCEAYQKFLQRLAIPRNCLAIAMSRNMPSIWYRCSFRGVR